MSAPVPGAESVQRLAAALVERLGPQAVRWVGTPPCGDIDAIGWRIASMPRFLFSVSTHAGELPADRFDLQISIVDDTLENGEIVFLDELGLQEACELSARYDRGEVQ
jgi:hypothetical protein